MVLVCRWHGSGLHCRDLCPTPPVMAAVVAPLPFEEDEATLRAYLAGGVSHLAEDGRYVKAYGVKDCLFTVRSFVHIAPVLEQQGHDSVIPFLAGGKERGTPIDMGLIQVAFVLDVFRMSPRKATGSWGR